MKFDYERTEKLIKSFAHLKIRKPSEKLESNFFEIAGYPHYENVMSNILSFFFDTEEEHGFKDLWIKSLLLCYLNHHDRNDISISHISTNNVLREYSNGSDKRIDLLIDCSSFLILIENKIYASLYNDLDIYKKMGKNYLKDTDNIGIPILTIVLSLSKVNDIKDKDVINITYEELIKEIEKNKKEYEINNKWDLLSEEFIENIKRRKHNMKINKEFMKFIEENIDDVSSFIDVYNSDCHERFEFCKKVNKAIKEKDDSIRSSTYSGGQSDPYYSVYIDTFLKDGTDICIETYVMKRPSKAAHEEYSKIYMALWCRTRRNKEYLDNIIKALDISNAIYLETNGWKEQYLIEILPIENVEIEKVAIDMVNYSSKILDIFNK